MWFCQLLTKQNYITLVAILVRCLLLFVCCLFVCVNLIQTGVIWKEGISAEKLSVSDWPMEYITDWLTWKDPVHCGQCHFWTAVSGLYKKTGWGSLGEQASLEVPFWSLFWPLAWLPSEVEGGLRAMSEITTWLRCWSQQWKQLGDLEYVLSLLAFQEDPCCFLKLSSVYECVHTLFLWSWRYRWLWTACYRCWEQGFYLFGLLQHQRQKNQTPEIFGTPPWTYASREKSSVMELSIDQMSRLWIHQCPVLIEK